MLEAVVFILGLLIGSFINVCIYRVPRQESIVFPASHCPSCEQPIQPYDNIPILSFLLLRGRCRSCRAPISWRYPLVEWVHGLGYLFILHQFGPSFAAVVYALFFSSLMAVTFIDLSHQIVPDVITLPGMVLGLLAASTILPPGPINSLIGLLLGGGLFYLVAILSIALLKKDPGKYNFGSIGNGSLSHLTMEAIAQKSASEVDGLFFAPALRRLADRYGALAELAADQAAVRIHRDDPGPLASALLAFESADPAVVGIAPERVDHLLGDAPRWNLPVALGAWGLMVIGGVAALAVLVEAAAQAPVNVPLLVAQSCMVVLIAVPMFIAAGGMLGRRRRASGSS